MKILTMIFPLCALISHWPNVIHFGAFVDGKPYDITSQSNNVWAYVKYRPYLASQQVCEAESFSNALSS